MFRSKKKSLTLDTVSAKQHAVPPTLVIEPSSDNDSVEDPNSSSRRPSNVSDINDSPKCSINRSATPPAGNSASNCPGLIENRKNKMRSSSYSPTCETHDGASPHNFDHQDPQSSFKHCDKSPTTDDRNDAKSRKISRTRKRGRSVELSKLCVHCLWLTKQHEQSVDSPGLNYSPNMIFIDTSASNSPSPSSSQRGDSNLSEEDILSATNAQPSMLFPAGSNMSDCSNSSQENNYRKLTSPSLRNTSGTPSSTFLEVPDSNTGLGDQKPRSSSVDGAMYLSVRAAGLNALEALSGGQLKPRASSVDCTYSASKVNKSSGSGSKSKISFLEFLKSRQGSSTGLNNVDSWRNLPSWNEECRNEDHLWVDTNASGDFCYVNEDLCSKSGLKKKCTACKIVIHGNCLDKLSFNCRPTFREAGVRNYREDKSATTAVNHHWVHRKRQEGKCKQCGKSFQTKFFNSKDIAAIECSWCKLAYHNKVSCFQPIFLTQPCAYGVHSGIIVPPSWIIKMPQKNHFKSSVRKQKSSPMKNLPHQHSLNITINSSSSVAAAESPFVVKPVPTPHLKPLIVFINPKSGGNQGIKLLHKFQWLLNPRQVFDLSDGGPRRGLEMFGKVPNLRILACGGDGTAGWILSMIDSLGISPYPPLAVLPLGTGNDLARTLNWGAGYEDEPISKILCCVEEGKVVALDRWNIETRLLSSKDLGGGIPQSISAQTLDEMGNPITIQTPGVECLPLNVCNNYFSLGADAATALEFHESREANPEKFNSRLKNKMFYAGVASKDILKRSWRDLFNHISLQCDGMDLTPRIKELRIHCLLFLNIPRYGAGTLPWGSPAQTGRFGPQAMDDGLMEVIGLSAASLATLQVGGHGERICQCRNVILTTSKIIPMQVDGEPCRLLPSTIEISLRNQAFLIKKPKRRTSMSILNDDVDNDLYNGPHQIKLSILVIPLVDYEENPFDRERLRIAATYYGVITVDSDSDLPVVRTQILQLIQETGKDLGKWVFLDSTTTDRFFRIDVGLEPVHFIMDICSEELYILSSSLPSSSVDFKQTDVHDFVKHILNQQEVKEFTREIEEQLNATTELVEQEIPEVIHKPSESAVQHANLQSDHEKHEESEDSDTEKEVQKEAVKIVSDVLVHAPLNLPEHEEEIPHEPSPSPELFQNDIIEESAEELEESDEELENPELLTDNNDEASQGGHLKELDDVAGSSKTTHRIYLSSDPVSYTEESLSKTNKKIEILKSKHQRKFSSKISQNKAFIVACNQSNVDKVKQLIDNGADFTAVDQTGCTGLHHVAKNGHIGVLHYLINNAPKDILELRDYETGQTALHKAAASGRRSVCSLLLSAGALCQARDNDGRTPRQLAEAANDHQLAQFLQSKEKLRHASSLECLT